MADTGPGLTAAEKKNLNNTAAPIPPTNTKPKSSSAKDDRSARPVTPQEVTTDKNKKFNVVPNPLDEYATYTYGISLHIVPNATYKDVVNKPNHQYNGSGNVLIASAGRRGDNFKRDANFYEDFYFDDLKFTTTIGSSSRSRATNVLAVSFTVVEPYGFTLLNRLLAVADAQSANNWGEMVFMLEIDFYGNTDSGTLTTPISGHTKYIPIKINDCKIKASSKGSEYQFSATPYNHVAFLEQIASTPVFLEVQAKTIGDFFNSAGSAGDAATSLSSEAASRAEADAAPKTRPGDTRASTAAATSPKYYKASSYAAAMNSYQKQLTAGKYQEYPDSYAFVIDSKISALDILSDKKNTVGNSPVTPVNSPSVAAGIDTTMQVFPINAGTSIIEVINMVMRNSSYVRNQIKEAGDKVKTNQPVEWYKIVPEVTLGNFDHIRQVFQKIMMYHIIPYAYFNTKFNKAEQSLPDSWAKEYFYMFTGKNQSILDFNIDFNAMFYTSMTVDRERIQKIAVNSGPDSVTKDDSGNAIPNVNVNVPIASNMIRNHATTQSGSGGIAGQSIDNAAANDLANSIMSNSRGDMINVILKISGDPGFIKQDDVFYGPSKYAEHGANGVLDKHNSLITDASDIFVLIEFRTPSDIDAVTGLMDFTSWSTSVFSGLYRVITVDNVFERGQFYQTLELVRLTDQSNYDTVTSAPASNTQRTATPSDISSSAAAGVSAVGKNNMKSAKIIPPGKTPATAP